MEKEKSNNIYATQVPPELQESELMRGGFPHFDEYYMDVITTGNDRYIGYTTKAYDTVQENLINGCEKLSNYCGKDLPYKNLTEAVHDCFPPEHKKKYSTQDIARWKKLIEEYDVVCVNGTWHKHEKEISRQALELITGKQYSWKSITGCSQGDWQYVLYPYKEVSENAIKALEAQYFNTGTEWIVHDEITEEDLVEDISPSDLSGGYSVYCHAWGDEEIRSELASYAGCDPKDVVMYKFEGYKQTPIYKLIA